jgi:hypothetical protein
MSAFLSRLPRLLVILLLAFLVTWYGLLFVRYISPAGGVEGADFLMFYALGRVAREHGLSQVYDLDLAAAAQAELSQDPVSSREFFPPNHPPFLNPFLALVAGLDYRQAYILHALLMFALVLAGFPALLGAFKKEGWQRRDLLLLVIGILLFEPLFISILKGQDSALLLLGGMLWLAGFLRQDDRLAGLGLSLTLIRPQLALVLALPFLFRQRRVWWWFCVGALALAAYSLLQVGSSGALDYLQVLSLSAAGSGYGMAEAAMVNFTGLIVRSFPGISLNISHLLGWSLYGVALVVLCLVWRFSRTLTPAHLALAVCLALFSAPHLHYHDLALLLVPILVLAMAVVRSGKWKTLWAALLLSLISLVLVFGEVWAPAGYLAVYILLLMLPFLAFLALKPATGQSPSMPV